MRLGFTVDVKGNVPVKVIARTFASGEFHLEKIKNFPHNFYVYGISVLKSILIT